MKSLYPTWRALGLALIAACAIAPLTRGAPADSTAIPATGTTAPLRSVPSSSPKSEATITSEAMFQKGNQLFSQAQELWKTDRPRAESLFKQAAAVWRELAQRDGIQNSTLETNIGNASTFGGDWPRAILAYRRALELDPRNEDARGGLAAARKAAGTEALATGAAIGKTSVREGGFTAAWNQITRLVGSGTDWLTRAVSIRVLLAVAVVAYFTAFGLLAARVLRIRSVRRWHVGAAATVCLLAFLTLVSRASGASDGAVVVASNAIARNGPSEVYDPTFAEKLKPGLEVRIDETRGQWQKVHLADGRATWVRREWLEPL